MATKRAAKAPVSKKPSIRKAAKKKAAPKKTLPSRKKPASVKAASTTNKKTRNRGGRRRSPAFVRETPDLRSGDQSGDLQGLSDVESADSESVDELVEEGNAFEAGVIEGVEDAGERREKEVHTREVPEDDVPDEYLDEQ
jgi:hypothetical protein